MKPAPFEYRVPASSTEATATLAETGGDGKVLAGGQTLVAAMNFRMARPAVLVDINRAVDLDYCNVDGGSLKIGALTRHAAFEQPLTEGPLGTFLPYIAHHIAHLPIRMRGTFCGSLAHADPAAEWCLVARTLDAEMTALSADGERTIAAEDFFVSILTTDLAENELLTEVRLPLLDRSWHLGFAEFSRRAGDFALAMALVAVRLGNDGKIIEAKVGAGAVEDRPIRVTAAEKLLFGEMASSELFAAAAEECAHNVDPISDLHASADYRRDLAQAMTRRALEHAFT